MNLTTYYNVAKLIGVVSLGLGLSACSMVSRFNTHTVTDSVDYKRNSGSVANLEVPPGLSKPTFDDTYTATKTTEVVETDLKTDIKTTETKTLEVADPAPVSTQTDSPTAAGIGMQAAMSRLADGNPTLIVGALYEEVWPATAAVLQRLNYKIVNQQTKQGVYSVQANTGEVYRIILGNDGNQSLIVVGDAKGKPLNHPEAIQILESLKVEFAR